MEYYVEDTINTLKNVKNNPYGIKNGHHALDRAQKRSIDLNIVNTNICRGLLVGIEKSLNETSIFQLLYEFTEKEDLCIVINILNEEEIEIITLIKKDVNKRRHYGY
ncbi:hypothetical protein [Methanobrevibacter sp.]